MPHTKPTRTYSCVGDLVGIHGRLYNLYTIILNYICFQLLAVLPAASKHLLPSPFHDLMTDEDSPIVHYYPVHFETDLNGKKNSWEAVVLIPFIDEVCIVD